MPSVLAYFRPRSLDEAATLLAEPNRRAIGGGTIVVPDARVQHEQGVSLVDLQGLGLDKIVLGAGEVNIGAMVRLGDLVADPRVPTLLRDLARHELPSAMRNQASIGGTVALGDADSVLLAGLLAHGALVHCHGHDPVAFDQLLESGVGSRLVTAVSFRAEGTGAWAATGRTPKDTPIVAAIAHDGADGLLLALTGVAERPRLADPADPAAGLDPPSDFRGSAGYRRHLAEVLSARAVGEVRR